MPEYLAQARGPGAVNVRAALDQARSCTRRIRDLEDQAGQLSQEYPDVGAIPPEVVRRMIAIVYTIAQTASDLASAHEVLDAACEIQERPAGWLSRLFGGP